MQITWTCIDFETTSALNLKKVGAWKYAESPTTSILCACYSFMGEPWKAWYPAGPHDDLMQWVNDDMNMFISFGDFERAIWRRIMVEDLGFPDIPNSRWHDVQAVAAMKQMPKDVDGLGRVLGLPMEKDMAASKLVVSLSRPDRRGTFPTITPEIVTTATNYCGRDVEVEVAQHRALGWIPPGERRCWLHNQRVNERGIAIDLGYVAACQHVVEEASKPLLREFRALTGCNPTQRDKFLGWCKGEGLDLPDLTKRTVGELLGEVDEDEEREEGALPTFLGVEMAPHVRRAMEIRSLVGSSSIKKLETMKLVTCADGRARGLLQYHGTGPGRSAGRLIQPQNFPKPPIKGLDPETVVDAIMSRDLDYIGMLGEPIPVVVGGLRQAITCAEDRVLMSADYAGIQARLVLATAGQHDKADLLARGLDIYCDMASQIYKRPITKKDEKERGTGKNAVLGLGFQMAGPTFQEKYARDHDLEFCNNVVHVYRKEWAPKVPYLWYGLEEAATKAVWEPGKAFEAYGVVYQVQDRWLTARLPSGRYIYYFNPQRDRQRAPWDPDKIKPCFTYQAQKMGVWRTIHAFGGQLAENVIMGMEADIMRKAQLQCEQEGFPIVLEVHDEIVAEPLAKDADVKAFTQILLDVDDWAKHIQVPIAIESWVGRRYRK